jgi:hypothetical protein
VLLHLVTEDRAEEAAHTGRLATPETGIHSRMPGRRAAVQCEECGTDAPDEAKGWRALLTNDDPQEVVCYCPDCAAREFGDD